MKALLPITVTIITKNEAKRIEGAINSVLSFASEVIVVDSESQDETVEISRKLGAKVFVEKFKGFGQQKNLAQSHATQEWVLNIDADERVTPELESEIRARFAKAQPGSEAEGYFLPRKTWYLDRWILHSGWYPNYLMRFARKRSASWTEPPIHETLQVKGKTEKLQSPLEHFSFPDQRSHILKNIEYAEQAKNVLLQKKCKANVFDLTLKPIWKFFDIFILKLGFLDGKAGLLIAIHSAYALFLRYTYLHEHTLKNSHHR